MEEIKPSALSLCDSNSRHFQAWYQVWLWGGSPMTFDVPSTRGLHLTAYLGLSSVLPLIIEQGVDLNVKDDYGNTALHTMIFAAARGRPWKDALKWLLHHNIDPNARNHLGLTALHVGISESRFDQQAEVVRQILESHPNLDVLDSHRMSPLRCAVIKGHIELVQLLLERGSTVDFAGTYGETALFAAVHDGHLQIVRMLLNAGADKEKQNDEGSTPFENGLRLYLNEVGNPFATRNQSSIELMVTYQAKCHAS